jgi:hypothetical protein
MENKHSENLEHPHHFGSGDEPNHYRTLGIQLFESDPAVIDAAVTRRIAEIRFGARRLPNSAVDKLLAEVATARSCLLHSTTKEVYDAALIASTKHSRSGQAASHEGITEKRLVAVWLLLVLAAGLTGFLQGIASVSLLSIASLSSLALAYFHATRKCPPGVEPAGFGMGAGFRILFWMAISLLTGVGAVIGVLVLSFVK